MTYTSDAATVATKWGGFADAESGMKMATWNIYRKHTGNTNNITFCQS